MRHISVLTKDLQDNVNAAQYWRDRCGKLEDAIDQIEAVIGGAQYDWHPEDFVLPIEKIIEEVRK